MLDALQAEDIGGEGLRLDLGFVNPEVGIAVQFAEADLILKFVAGLVGGRTSADAALGQLADDRAAVIDLRHRHGRRPEDGDAVDKNERKEADDHTQADDQAEAGEPDPSFAPGRAAIGRGGHGLDDFIALTQALTEDFRKGVDHEGEQEETARPEKERAEVGVTDSGLR